MYKLSGLLVLGLCHHQVADLSAHLVGQQSETHQLLLAGRQQLVNQGLTLQYQSILIV